MLPVELAELLLENAREAAALSEEGSMKEPARGGGAGTAPSVPTLRSLAVVAIGNEMNVSALMALRCVLIRQVQ